MGVPQACTLNQACPASVTVFSVNGIGDAFLSIPTMRALNHIFPNKIKLIYAPESTRFLWDRGTMVLIPADARPRHILAGSSTAPRINVRGIAELVGQTDIFVSLVNWWSDELAELVSRVSPNLTIGTGRHFDEMISWRERHTVEALFQIPRLFEPQLSPRDFWGFDGNVVALPPLASARARANCDGLYRLAIHMDTSEDKMWDGDLLRELLTKLLHRHPQLSIILLGMEDPGLADLSSHPRVLNGLRLPLSDSLALISQSDLFLGVDSCFLHAADLFRKPGVGLFRRGFSLQWGFYSKCDGLNIEATGRVSDIPLSQVVEALEELIWSNCYKCADPRSSKEIVNGSTEV